MDRIFIAPEVQPPQFIDAFFLDKGNDRIYLCQSNILTPIAGIKGRTGDRDGEGSQALFNFNITSPIAYTSLDECYVGQSTNLKVKKIKKQVDGTWQVSTFLTNVSPSSICKIGSSLWVFSGNSLIEYDSNSSIVSEFTLPNLNSSFGWVGGAVDSGGRIYVWIYEGGPATSLWRFDTNLFHSNPNDPGVFTHIAGMRYSEWITYSNDLRPVDGPLLNCGMYKCDMAYMSGENPPNLIIFGGGDTRRFIYLDFVNKISKTLLKDGTLVQLPPPADKYQIDGSGNPAFFGIPSGMSPTGYPYSFVYPWDWQQRTFWQEIALVQDQSEGGTVNNSQFITQTIPSTMEAGKQYAVSITMSNTGDTTWSEVGTYHLGFVKPSDPLSPSPDDPVWASGGRLLITGKVAPGAQYTFIGTVTAPAKPGTYGMQLRMVQESLQWFGAVTNPASINVTPTQGNTMTKTGTLTYGSLSVNTGAVLSAIKVDLMASDGSVALAGPNVNPSSTTISMNVPDGTGWKFRVTNLDQNGAVISQVLSNTFDVQSSTVIQVVVGISVQ